MPRGQQLLSRSSAIAFLAASLSGCAPANDWLRGSEPEPRDDVVVETPTTDSYLQELQRLVTGDPYTQVEIHADAKVAASLAPNPSNRLRYALVLGTPGHAESDPEKAASLLRELLAQTEMMTAKEVALATIYLKNIDDRLVLAAEARRLRSASSAAQSAEQRAVAGRIGEIEAENAALRNQLAEAEQKLEALTSIERSIREQENEIPDPPPDSGQIGRQPP